MNVEVWTTGVHTGTPADAPILLLEHGFFVHERPLKPFIGPCRVLDVSSRKGVQVPNIERADP